MNENLIPKNIFFSIANKDILNDSNNKNTQIINKFQENYSDFEIFILDDNESYKVIEEYGDNILEICYEEILPGAYKCDILRLVLLEKYGGIYIDLGLYPDPEYLLPIIDNNDLVLCQDRAQHGEGYKIYNAIMASVKNHIFIKNVIMNIKMHISNFSYGRNSLDITGPAVVGQVFSEMYHIKPANRTKHYENYNSLKLNKSVERIYIKLNHLGDGKIKDHLGKIICDKKERDHIGNSKIFLPSSKCNHYSFLYHEKLIFFQMVYSSFHKSAKKYYIDKDGYLCAFLKDCIGKWNFSKIKYEKYRCYDNIDGKFKAGKFKELSE